MNIRTGTFVDIEPSATIWEQAHEKRLGTIPRAASKTHAMAVLASRVGLRNAKFLIAQGDSGIAGMLLANQAREHDGQGDPIPGLMHIGYIAVAPMAWGQGIASALLARIASEALREGYARLQLWVATSNERARNIYERFGFVFSGREKVDDDYEELIMHYVINLVR